MLHFAHPTACLLRSCKHLFAAAVLALAGGCALFQPPSTPSAAAAQLTRAVIAAATAENCSRWYDALDTAIAEAGTLDAGSARISGFPALRADRFAASFRPAFDTASATPTEQQTALLDYLQQLDSEARQFEVANLPSAMRSAYSIPPSAQLRALLDACSTAMTRAIFIRADKLSALAQALTVADHYADWKRALGVYPLTAIPFFQGVNAWQRNVAQRFAKAAASDAGASSRYVPQTQNADSAAVMQRYIESPRNALGIPQLNAGDWSRLLLLHAPVFDIEHGAYGPAATDRIGALAFDSSILPAVDSNQPLAYRRIAFTRLHGKTLTQLVYSVWFPERPADKWIDLLAGRLDGVIVRITLDERGAPLLVDSIHACGCYHLFFPTPRLAPRPPPTTNTEWAFIPTVLPAMKAGQRVQVRLAASSHYLLDIRAYDEMPSSSDIGYQLRDENVLRSLPLAGDARKSLYERDGLVAGTERGERFLFWPMGIASPGAMRQWGTHATAFVGRRHFDDADLIEQRFELLPPQP